MARNLMVSAGPEGDQLVVIDHQDLRHGPKGYDIASLLHDSCRLSHGARARLERAGGAPCSSVTYHRLVVQRMLKIVGTFHAFARRGAPQYLPMVPQALDSALLHLEELPELGAIAARLREALAPSSS
jgi:aminoglycoside/choline kinase family phosphotransferase